MSSHWNLIGCIPHPLAKSVMPIKLKNKTHLVMKHLKEAIVDMEGINRSVLLLQINVVKIEEYARKARYLQTNYLTSMLQCQRLQSKRTIYKTG